MAKSDSTHDDIVKYLSRSRNTPVTTQGLVDKFGISKGSAAAFVANQTMGNYKPEAKPKKSRKQASTKSKTTTPPNDNLIIAVVGNDPAQVSETTERLSKLVSDK